MTRSHTSKLLFLCLLASGCGLFGGLDEEEQRRLTLFQQNAQLYYDGERLDQALDSAKKGLEIDPDNYKLLYTAGWCYLRLGDTELANNYFTRAYQQRSPSNHIGQVLLGYGRTQQLLGNEHARLAEAETARAERLDVTETERTLATSRAEEHRERARAYWKDAERIYRELIDREELLRFAYKGLMEIEVERGNYEGAVAEGESCLARNLDEQEIKRTIIRETNELDYERYQSQQLEQLLDQEKRVRAALAEMHFRREAYDLAVEQLTALLKLDPTRSTDYYNRGRALEKLGESEEARRDYDKFLGTTNLPYGDERVAHAYDYISHRP